MELTKADYQLFQQEHFALKKLNEQLSITELDSLKQNYKINWQRWRSLHLACAKQLPTEYGMQLKVKNWRNAGLLHNHFWSAYRCRYHLHEQVCLAVLLNQKQFQIYLMFQHQLLESQSDLASYNQLLEVLPAWSQNVDIKNYYIWAHTKNSVSEPILLMDYLADEVLQANFLISLAGGSFQIGKLFFETDPILDLEAEIVEGIEELAPLYFALK